MERCSPSDFQVAPSPPRYLCSGSSQMGKVLVESPVMTGYPENAWILEYVLGGGKSIMAWMFSLLGFTPA